MNYIVDVIFEAKYDIFLIDPESRNLVAIGVDLIAILGFLFLRLLARVRKPSLVRVLLGVIN